MASGTRLLILVHDCDFGKVKDFLLPQSKIFLLVKICSFILS